MSNTDAIQPLQPVGVDVLVSDNEQARLAIEKEVGGLPALAKLVEQARRFAHQELPAPEFEKSVQEIFAAANHADRLERLRRVRGMWKDRDDLIPLEELRQESNRY